jgi:hypothetical protein
MVRQEAKKQFIGIDEQYFARLLYKRLKHITFTNSAKSYGSRALKSNQQLIVESNPKPHLLYHFEKKTVGISTRLSISIWWLQCEGRVQQIVGNAAVASKIELDCSIPTERGGQ